MSDGKMRVGFLSEMQRFPDDGWIAGVCMGIADYFSWKVQWVRLIAFLLLIFTAGWLIFIIYCVLWYVMDPGSLQDPNRPNYRRPPIDPNASRWATPPDGPGSAPGGAAADARPGANMTELKARFAKLEERLRNMEECVTSKDFDLRRELRRLET